MPRYAAIDETVKRGSAAGGKDALLVIDAQIGFCQSGAGLYVPGAEKDVQRLTEFVYRNAQSLGKLFFSLNTHHVFQIFYPSFWKDVQGQAPAPFTLITAEAVAAGRWQPLCSQELAVDYLRRLEADGKYSLCLWPYHTMLGSVDHALQPVLFECAVYHALAASSEPEYIVKGEQPLTENYSVFTPEVRELSQGKDTVKVGVFNQELVEGLANFERIFIAGEASSHCVKATVEDLTEALRKLNPDLVKKIHLLADCMSPVSATPDIDFPALAREALQGFAEAGLQVVKSTDY